MKPKEMKKINRRIQEYIDTYRPEGAAIHSGLNRLKRNRAKRLSRKLRGVK